MGREGKLDGIGVTHEMVYTNVTASPKEVIKVEYSMAKIDAVDDYRTFLHAWCVKHGVQYDEKLKTIAISEIIKAPVDLCAREQYFNTLFDYSVPQTKSVDDKRVSVSTINKAKIAVLEAEVKMIKRSVSWQITAPLRFIFKIGRIITKPRNGSRR